MGKNPFEPIIFCNFAITFTRYPLSVCDSKCRNYSLHKNVPWMSNKRWLHCFQANEGSICFCEVSVSNWRQLSIRNEWQSIKTFRVKKLLCHFTTQKAQIIFCCHVQIRFDISWMYFLIWVLIYDVTEESTKKFSIQKEQKEIQELGKEGISNFLLTAVWLERKAQQIQCECLNHWWRWELLLNMYTSLISLTTTVHLLSTFGLLVWIFCNENLIQNHVFTHAFSSCPTNQSQSKSAPSSTGLDEPGLG